MFQLRAVKPSKVWFYMFPPGTTEQVLDRKILSVFFFEPKPHAAGLFWTLEHLFVQTLPPGNASFQNSSI